MPPRLQDPSVCERCAGVDSYDDGDEGGDGFVPEDSESGRVVAPVNPRHPVVWVDPEDKGAFVVPEAYPDERLWKDQEELALGGAEWVEGEDLGIVIGTELEIHLEDFSSV